MKLLKRILAGLFLVGMLLVARASDPVLVALMVHRPDNRLAWGAHDEAAAYMLGCDALLRRVMERAPWIREVGPYRVNGIVQAMNAGLYFPEGEGVVATWRPFIEADIFVDARFDRERLQWRAGAVGGPELLSEVIVDPYRHPVAGVAALIRLVFEAAGAELPEGWEGELGSREPSPADLFVEWAKWLGYQPHWAHHAPWTAPQQSAMRILNTDPGFVPGAAWAVGMIMRDGSGYHHRRGEQPSPASVLQLMPVMRLLGTPQASAAYPFLRTFLPQGRLLDEIPRLFDLPMIDTGALTTGEPRGMAGPVDMEQLARDVTGPAVRRDLAEAVGRLDSEIVRETLALLLRDDADAVVRATAARELAGHRVGQADVLRRAFDADADGDVRAAAWEGLVRVGAVQAADIAQAARDAAPEVRRAVVETLADTPVSGAAREEIWARLLADPAVEVRLACIRLLHARTDRSPGSDALQARVAALLESGGAAERSALLSWIAERPDAAIIPAVQPLLQAEASGIRAGAATALYRCAPDRAGTLLRALRDDPSAAVQRSVAAILAEVGGRDAAGILYAMLRQAPLGARDALLAALYRVTGADRTGLARAMRFDEALIVNLAGVRLAERLGDPDLLRELLPALADTHPNPYVRAEALRAMERHAVDGMHERCLAGLAAPFWIVRLEAADILSRHARSVHAAPLRAALEAAQDPWLRMACEDALARAQDRPPPERVRLGLGTREHTEGGNAPLGFQVWLGRMPRDPETRRRLVDEGYRFGATTKPPNFAGGTGLNNYNRSDGLRNQYLLESVLEEIGRLESALPHMTYLALFDEPCGPGHSGTDGMRAMVLEAGRPDLLPAIERAGEEGLPPAWQRTFDWYDARLAAEGSNWVVHMFRLTAQRKYQNLLIFPQSLSYMGTQMRDAFHLLDADGDYTWRYHHHNFFGDGSIGAVNRVLHPGKPLNAITWMGWHQINVLRGNTLNMNTDFPQAPWRMRDYMGTKSALALWATGTEPGFFTGVSFAKVYDSDGRSHSPGATGGAFDLKPWSEAAREAVEFMLNDERYWRDVEAKLALEIEKPQIGRGDALLDGANAGRLDIELGDEDAITHLLEGGLTALEKAIEQRKAAMFERLMTGIAYMNIFNTDTTRVLSSLPKPDTRLRENLIILGRDTPYNQDGGSFPIPAIAFAGGYDMLPAYEGIGAAELRQYDTILLRASRDGVTPALVRELNRWVREKAGGLLIVSGALDSGNLLFPELLGGEPVPFVWDDDVQATRVAHVEEATRDRRGREETRQVPPPVGTFSCAGIRHADEATRVEATFGGRIVPLIETADGAALLARWESPAEVRGVVLFDGAAGAGPVYTEALETAVLAIDRERGSRVMRNPWWGHLTYENDAFVVDVATRQFRALQEARPRRHTGVDMITGEINPEVRNGECAVIFKDYVGPYAGGRGNWAVLARRALTAMTAESANRLRVEAEGVVRITRIGPEPIRLGDADGFAGVANQVEVWRLKTKGQPAYSANAIDGGYELHVYSPSPFTVVTADGP